MKISRLLLESVVFVTHGCNQNRPAQKRAATSICEPLAHLAVTIKGSWRGTVYISFMCKAIALWGAKLPKASEVWVWQCPLEKPEQCQCWCSCFHVTNNWEQNSRRSFSKALFLVSAKENTYSSPRCKAFKTRGRLLKKKKRQKNFQWAYIGRSTDFWHFESSLIFSPIMCCPQFLTKSFIEYPSANKSNFIPGTWCFCPLVFFL